MRKNGLNNADKILFIAGILFLLTFFLQLKFKGNIFFAGLFFCAEAALVGGIADWFAVTALFEKPLGFPYHTEILPRRREEFIAACIKMVQQEFFSKKQIISRLRGKTWREKLLARLTTDSIIDGIKKQLWRQLQAYLIAKDWAPYKALIKEKFLAYVRQFELKNLGDIFSGYLERENRGKLILARLAEELRPMAERKETAVMIEKMLADYQLQHIRNPIMAFFASMAVSADMLNLNEAAKLVQRQMTGLLTELAEPDSQLQNLVLNTVLERFRIMTGAEEMQVAFVELREKLLADCEIEESINRAVDALVENLLGDTADSELQLVFDRIFTYELAKLVEKLQSDGKLQEPVENLLYDIAAHGALQAQAAIGSVVRTALAQMTEEQLNQIVRDKVEPDLIWIRINGSVVGAVIGLALFTLLTVIRSMV